MELPKNVTVGRKSILYAMDNGALLDHFTGWSGKMSKRTHIIVGEEETEVSNRVFDWMLEWHFLDHAPVEEGRVSRPLHYVYCLSPKGKQFVRIIKEKEAAKCQKTSL